MMKYIATFVIGAALSSAITWKIVESLALDANLLCSTSSLTVSVYTHKGLLDGNFKGAYGMLEDTALYEFAELKKNKGDAFISETKDTVQNWLDKEQWFLSNIETRKSKSPNEY